MDRFVNIALLANPVNWVIVILMLTFGAFALCLIMSGPNWQVT